MDKPAHQRFILDGRLSFGRDTIPNGIDGGHMTALFQHGFSSFAAPKMPFSGKNAKRKPVIRTITKMNDSELAHFSALILARLDELANSTASGKSAQAVVELDQQAVGRLSRMDALQNQAMAKAHQASRDLERRRLTAALNRIRDGEYGFCEDCGEEVPVGRLKLDLAATKCVSCASG
ncbi:hypothetical protein NBRC116589_05100 [Ruegeria sp. HU-ET01832]